MGCFSNGDHVPLDCCCWFWSDMLITVDGLVCLDLDLSVQCWQLCVGVFEVEAVVASIYSIQPCMTSLLPFRYSILVNNPSPGETTVDHRSSTALTGQSRVGLQVDLRIDHITDRDAPHSSRVNERTGCNVL